MTKHKMASRKVTTAKTAGMGNNLTSKIFYLCISILILIGAGFSYQWYQQNARKISDLMPIRIVEITGELNHISRQQIIEQLQKSLVTTNKDTDNSEDTGYIGFFGSDLAMLEQRLIRLAWLQKVTLRRVWPDRLQITIVEQKAIARWNDDALINEFGMLFKPGQVADFEQLPLLKGHDQDLPQMLQTFRELQKLFESANLQLKVLTLNHRYSWSLELTSGIHLEVGRINLVERVQRFIALYPLLQSESDLPIAKIDLRYDTGLAVTRIKISEQHASL